MPRWYVPNGHDAVDRAVYTYALFSTMRSNYCQNYLGHLSPKASSSHISLDIWANMKISSPKARATLLCGRINQWVSLNSFCLIVNTTLCCRMISELTEVFFSKPDIVTTYYCIKSFYWSQFWVASTWSSSAFSTYIRRGRERIEQICRCVTHI